MCNILSVQSRSACVGQSDSPTVGGGAEVVVASLYCKHGAQELVAGLAPLGYQGSIRDLFSHKIVVLRPGMRESTSINQTGCTSTSKVRTSSCEMALRTYLRS